MFAVIPARGGSKGVPLKNIINVGGRPLIHYSIQCAKGSRYIDRTVISTDDLLIKRVSEECGGDVPFMRPAELAKDTSKSIDALVHAVDTMNEMDGPYDYVVLLQNTVPLRKSWVATIPNHKI